jgi:RNA polymerase sigma-70 factor (ECF subfamily)
MMSGLTVAAEGPGGELEVSLSTSAGRAAAMPLTAEDLCHRYSATVCRFAAMVAGGELEAEDLAQEALLKAVRNLHRFDPAKGSMDGWLWRIVANVARDAFRARSRRLATWQRFMSRWHEHGESVEDRALADISHGELIAAVRSLDQRDRLLIALRYGADLDLAKVGAAVGLSAGSAGQAVLRALSRLRRRLEVSR